MCEPSSDGSQSDHWEEAPQGKRLHFTPSLVPDEHRQARFGHGPLTILITGLSGSGKTTLAYALEARLFAAGRAVMVLDGQNLRRGISRDLGFSADERSENLRRAAEIALLINKAGLICIAAFVAPDATIREKARQLIGVQRWFHIHLATPVEVCRQRDGTGRYAAADRGEIVNFPGVTMSYDAPITANLVLSTERLTVEQCLEQIEVQLLTFHSEV